MHTTLYTNQLGQALKNASVVALGYIQVKSYSQYREQAKWLL